MDDIRKKFVLYEHIRKHLVVWVAVGALLAVWVVFTAMTVFLPPHGFPSDKIFEVGDGQGVGQIAEDLKSHDIIRSPSLFVLLIKIFGHERDLKAGLYYFEQPLSLIDMVYRLTDGNYEVAPFRATIKEGATIYGMGLFFQEKGLFSAEDFWKIAGLHLDHYSNGAAAYFPLVGDYSSKTDLLALKPADVGLEGFLFPDTYFFPPSVTPEGIVRAMLENFDRKITPDLREAISAQGKNFYDVLIIASIIQREAFDENDAPVISGILWKRLENNYPLQVDAVLAYITGRGSFALSKDDLNTDSRYNVYKRIGLPPTPISNPGLMAIQAAVYPEETEYWYYLHDAKGKAHYAKTFEEHKMNKVRYLR